MSVLSYPVPSLPIPLYEEVKGRVDPSDLTKSVSQPPTNEGIELLWQLKTKKIKYKNNPQVGRGPCVDHFWHPGTPRPLD